MTFSGRIQNIAWKKGEQFSVAKSKIGLTQLLIRFLQNVRQISKAVKKFSNV